MKKVIALIIATMLMVSTITATAAAAEPTHGASAGSTSPMAMIEAPAGYLCPETLVETPDSYTVEDEAVLGEPLVAYTLSYLDELALEKGYIIVEADDGVSRTYIHDESGYMTTIVIESDFATVCVHCGEMPGAIMGVWCYADEDMVYSTVDLVDLLF